MASELVLAREQWPVFAAELAAALEAHGDVRLTEQVDGPYGPGHANVCLDAPWAGYLILDVVDGAISYVEVLYRSPLN